MKVGNCGDSIPGAHADVGEIPRSPHKSFIALRGINGVKDMGYRRVSMNHFKKLIEFLVSSDLGIEENIQPMENLAHSSLAGCLMRTQERFYLGQKPQREYTTTHRRI